MARDENDPRGRPEHVASIPRKGCRPGPATREALRPRLGGSKARDRPARTVGSNIQDLDAARPRDRRALLRDPGGPPGSIDGGAGAPWPDRGKYRAERRIPARGSRLGRGHPADPDRKSVV